MGIWNGLRAYGGALLAFILTACACAAQAQEVALAGVMGGKALLVIDGGAPRAVTVGQQLGGVRLLRVSADTAEVEAGGKRMRIALGEQPVSVAGAGNSPREITLIADARGHFFTSGRINGSAVRFLVDTGASAIAMGPAMARAAGIDYQRGEQSMANTANGVVPVWRVRIASVSLGGITMHDVEGIVVQSELSPLLLGMSFLNRMEMRRDGSQMLLRQRY